MKNQKGISMITLIITIVVMIILATIAFVSSGSSVDSANKAKFDTSYADFRDAVRMKSMNAIAEQATLGNIVSVADSYKYGAKSDGVVTGTGDTVTVASLFTAVPAGITGTNAYKIDTALYPEFSGSSVFSVAGTGAYVSDTGIVFVLPGYTYNSLNYTTNSDTYSGT